MADEELQVENQKEFEEAVIAYLDTPFQEIKNQLNAGNTKELYQKIRSTNIIKAYNAQSQINAYEYAVKRKESLIKILENFRNKYGKGNYGQEINETAQAANFLIQTLDSYAILASTHSITNIIYELIIDQLLQNNQNTVRQSSPPPETNAPINTPIKVDEGENGEQQKNTETPTEQQETGLTTYEK